MTERRSLLGARAHSPDSVSVRGLEWYDSEGENQQQDTDESLRPSSLGQNRAFLENNPRRGLTNGRHQCPEHHRAPKQLASSGPPATAVMETPSSEQALFAEHPE